MDGIESKWDEVLLTVSTAAEPSNGSKNIGSQRTDGVDSDRLQKALRVEERAPTPAPPNRTAIMKE